MTIVSSASMPMPPWPLDASRPTTSQEKLLTRISVPTGLSVPNSSRRTVEPITHAARPARSSASVKKRPLARRQLLVWK